jgi:hypothetical protein
MGAGYIHSRPMPLIVTFKTGSLFWNQFKTRNMKSKTKTKLIAASGVLSGSAVGVFLCWLAYRYNLQTLLVLYVAFCAISTLAAMTMIIIADCRNENKTIRSSQPANWGFDKSYEQ